MTAKFTKRSTAMLLCVLMMFSMFAMPVSAETITDSQTIDNDDGIVVTKTTTFDPETGEGKITLETYVTGKVEVESRIQTIPTDIILIADQSGSMDDNIERMSTSTYYEERPASASVWYNYRNSREYYVKLSNDTYARVSIAQTTGMVYEQCTDESNWTLYNSGSVYHKHSDGSYHRVNVDRDGLFIGRYTYECRDCSWEKDGDNLNSFRSELYIGTNRTLYTYTYTDTANGNQPVSFGPSQDLPSWTLYRKQDTTTNKSKLTALQEAVESLSILVQDNIVDKYGETIQHKLGLVGFSYGPSNYSNTEIFVGSSVYNYNSADGHYDEVLQDMTTTQGINNIIASKEKLDGNGATYAQYGFLLAYNVLEANVDEVYGGENVYKNGERKAVIIFLTDGQPGSNGYEKGTASSAIDYAHDSKVDFDATVYSIGIFTKSDRENTNVQNFMKYVTSQYPDATSVDNHGSASSDGVKYFYTYGVDGNIENIFGSIVNDVITESAARIELTDETVLKDVLSADFNLPEGADADSIKVYTQDCTGADSSGKLKWADSKVEFADADVQISSDGKTITVTNFDLAKYYCSGKQRTITGTSEKTYGKKLIVEIPIVTNVDTFGGNEIYSNEEGSGIIAPGEDEPVVPFPRPQTNIKIKYETAVKDQNIYITESVNYQSLISTATGYVADGENNAHVDIVYTIKNAEGTAIATFTIPAGKKYEEGTFKMIDGVTDKFAKPTADTTYSISCVVTATDKNASGQYDKLEIPAKTANVYVWVPTVTYQDSEIYLGGTAGDYSKTNFVSAEWEHSTSTTKPTSEAPALTYEYTPAAGAFTSDTYVNATVKAAGTDITGSVVFEHSDCSLVSNCGFDADDGEFIVHVKTCELTIAKAGDVNPDDAFIFTVTGPNGINVQVVLKGGESVTLTNLPVGTYNVNENSDWSWRYDSEKMNGSATLSATESGSKATVTITNVKNNNSWLDDSDSVENFFGLAN